MTMSAREQRSYIALRATLENVFNYVASVQYDGCIELRTPDNHTALLRFEDKLLKSASYREQQGVAAIRLMKQEPVWKFRFSSELARDGEELAINYATFCDIQGVASNHDETAQAAEPETPAVEGADDEHFSATESEISAPGDDQPETVETVTQDAAPVTDADPDTFSEPAQAADIDKLQQYFMGYFSKDSDVVYAALVFDEFHLTTLGGERSSLVSGDLLPAWDGLLASLTYALQEQGSRDAEGLPNNFIQSTIKMGDNKIVVKQLAAPRCCLAVLMASGTNPAYILADVDSFIKDAPKITL